MCHSFWQRYMFVRISPIATVICLPVHRIWWSSGVLAKTFSAIYNKYAPFKTKRIKYTRKPPWLSKEIEEAMHLRNKLLKSRKHQDFKKQRNKVTSMLRVAPPPKKKHPTPTFQDLVASKNDSRAIWKAINNLTNKATSKPSITTNDISPYKGQIEIKWFKLIKTLLWLNKLEVYSNHLIN